jgi:membrane protein DedA with SNARE-associated domain
MTETRKVLLWSLLPLFALLIVAGMLGGVGSVELSVWLVLLAAWIVAFARSGRRRDETRADPR